jgi:hypothetical protein
MNDMNRSGDRNGIGARTSLMALVAGEGPGMRRSSIHRCECPDCAAAGFIRSEPITARSTYWIEENRFVIGRSDVRFVSSASLDSNT